MKKDTTTFNIFRPPLSYYLVCHVLILSGNETVIVNFDTLGPQDMPASSAFMNNFTPTVGRVLYCFLLIDE